jgi:hypothetical protein
MIEVVCEGSPDGHHFAFLVRDSDGRVQGIFTNLIFAHGFDEFLKAQEIMMRYQGKAPPVSTAVQRTETFSEKWTREEHNMDNQRPKDDGSPDGDPSGHAAPNIPYRPDAR